MNTRNAYLGTVAALSLMIGGAGGAAAASPQDPSTGGQLNQCWGQVAAQIAKLDTSGVNANGGGMGIHSRAAAGQGETFGDNPPFGEPFNTDGGRTGVGNVSQGFPHNTHPGDGGNGQHAINNGLLSSVFNPLTGAFGSTFQALLCTIAP